MTQIGELGKQNLQVQRVVILLEFFFQLVEKPNRARRDDKPSILDLVRTDDIDLVQNIEDIGPLGMSDHSILNIECGIPL